MKVFYDLHIHSALSPCGDDDMTPNNIINMARLKGLDIIAVIDHNACGNIRPIIKLAEKEGGKPVVLPGMELTTSEDIHVLCLFRTIEDAEEFESQVFSRQVKVKNNVNVFGCQTLLDESDRPVGEQDWLLIMNTDIGIYQVSTIIRKYNGICMPAHVDKCSNGLYSILGAIDEDMGFFAVEIKDGKDNFVSKHPELHNYRIFSNSDAHYLCDINEPCGENSLETESLNIDDIFRAIKGGQNG